MGFCDHNIFVIELIAKFQPQRFLAILLIGLENRGDVLRIIGVEAELAFSGLYRLLDADRSNRSERAVPSDKR